MAFDLQGFAPNRFVSAPPLSSTSYGAVGAVAIDGSFLYYCDVANHWIRTALTNFNSWRAAIDGGTLHLDASTLVLNDGDSVTTWTDTSASANTPTEATHPPIYKVNIINNRPVLRFNGTNTILTCPNALSSGELSVFVVTAMGVAAASQSQYACLIIGGPTGGSPRVNLRLAGTNWGFWSGADQASGEDLVNGAWNILEIVSSVANTSSTMYRNGVLKATVAAVPSTAGATQKIIGNETGFTRFANADIAEIVVFNSVLSTSNRTYVELYLSNKYGIALG